MIPELFGLSMLFARSLKDYLRIFFSYHGYWVSASLISILVVGGTRFIAPDISYRDSFTTITILPAYISAFATMLTMSILVVVAIWTTRFYPFAKSVPYKILLIVLLLLVVSVDLLPQFNTFMVAPDSDNYFNSYWKGKSKRHPGYYTFMSLVTGEDPSSILKRYPELYKQMNKPIEDKKYRSLTTIIRAQKLFLIGAWLICCFIMMSFISPPLVAGLFLGLLWLNNVRPVSLNIITRHAIPAGLSLLSMSMLVFQRRVDWKQAALFSFCAVPLGWLLFFLTGHVGFISKQINYFLSEPLVQAFLMIIISLVIAFYYKGWNWLLPATALFCGLMYQTRPAAAFGFVIIGIMVLSALMYDRRRYLFGSVTAIILVAVVSVGPNIYMDKIVSKKAPSMLSWSKIAFALQIAEPEDIKYIKSERGKRFFKLALEMKAEKKKILDPENEWKWGWEYHVLNLYYVAHPLADKYFHLDNLTMIPLFNEVGNPILWHRFDRYLKMVAENFICGMTTQYRPNKGPVFRSRLDSPMSIWLILAISAVLMFWLKGPNALAAMTLIAGHYTHLLVVSMFDAPRIRYVYATEILLIIAIFLLVAGAAHKIFGKPDLNITTTAFSGAHNYRNFNK